MASPAHDTRDSIHRAQAHSPLPPEAGQRARGRSLTFSRPPPQTGALCLYGGHALALLALGCCDIRATGSLRGRAQPGPNAFQPPLGEAEEASCTRCHCLSTGRCHRARVQPAATSHSLAARQLSPVTSLPTASPWPFYPPLPGRSSVPRERRLCHTYRS